MGGRWNLVIAKEFKVTVFLEDESDLDSSDLCKLIDESGFSNTTDYINEYEL
jgi:hypothetical protein